MPKSRRPYPAEFRAEMVRLVRAGRTPGELSQEFEPSDQTIRNWVDQARCRCRPQGGSNHRRTRGVAPGEPDPSGGEGDPGKSSSLVRRGDRIDTAEAFGFVKANQATHSVRRMCELLGVSPSGYYASLSHPTSARERTDRMLRDRIVDFQLPVTGHLRSASYPRRTELRGCLCGPQTSGPSHAPGAYPGGSPPPDRTTFGSRTSSATRRLPTVRW